MGLREKYGIHEHVDLGEEEISLDREMWEAGRERRGLPLEEGDKSGEGNVKAIRGTPGSLGSASLRKGKGRGGEVGSPSLAQVLRKTTARRYDPFADAADAFLSPGGNGAKVKGRIKDPVLESGGARAAEEKAVESPEGFTVLGVGLLAGYGSD